MANDINKEDPHYKGEYGSIYEVNRKFPTGGVAGDFVVIDGWAHYWNQDRGTWCVNAKRDSYWDELITNNIEKFKSDIAILKDLIRAATGMPQDLLDKMVEYNAVLEQVMPYIRNMSEITESDIGKIIAGTYVPEQTNPPHRPDSDLISYVKAIDVKVTDTGKKLDQFIASDLTTEQVNDLLDKQNDNINI